jgi:hypothetical protein
MGVSAGEAGLGTEAEAPFIPEQAATSDDRTGRAQGPKAPFAARFGTLRGRCAASARRAAPAVGLYLGLRVISGLSFLLVMSHNRRFPLGQFLTLWDAYYYRLVATEGYGGTFPVQAAHGGAYAFFPLYPGLMRALAVLPGLTVVRAGVLISLLASIATAWGLYEVGRRYRDARTGILLAGMWALVPVAVIQGLVYADALFTALAVWTLYALARRWWITAGVLCLFAGLTRPTGFVLILAVFVAAVGALLRQRGARRPWVAVVIGAVGAGTYVLSVGLALGSPTGYFKMQRQRWDNYIDWGAMTWHSVADVFFSRNNGVALVFIIAMFLVLAAPVLVYAQLRDDRQPVPWKVFSIGVVFMALASSRFFATTSRELMPALPFLLLPLAAALTRTRRGTVLAAFVLLAFAAGWYGWFVPLYTGYAP